LRPSPIYNRGSDFVAFGLLVVVLAVLNVVLLLTGSVIAFDAMLIVVGLLAGSGIAEIVARSMRKRRAGILLGAGAVAALLAYQVLGSDGIEFGDPYRLLFGLAIGLANGTAITFRRLPTPEEVQRRREQARRSRPAVLVVGGMALLLTAAAFLDAYLRGV
jgi:hypothetical protein